MKRLISLLLSILFIIALPIGIQSADPSVYSVSFEAEDNAQYISTLSEPILSGDVNGDGIITSKDAKIIQSHLISKETDAVRFALDLNKDGIIGLKDISVLIKIMLGKEDASHLSNTTVQKAFDAEEKAVKLTVSSTGDSDASFDFKIPSFDSSNYSFAAVIWKGAKKAEVGFVSKTNETSYCESVTASTDSGYSYASFSLPASKDSLKYLEFKYDGSPIVGDVLYIDSIILANDEDTLKNSAKSICRRRNGASGEPFTLDLSSASSFSYFTDRNMTAIVSDSGAAKLLSAGPSDTYAVLNLQDFNLSADVYKYVVCTVMLPTTDTQTNPSGKLTFFAGDNVRGDGKAERSIQYSLVKDGVFHSVIVDMSNASFWKGIIHEIKINNLVTPTPGLSSYVKSVSLCRTYEEASSLCQGRDENTIDFRHLYNYGIYDNGTMQMSYRLYLPMTYKSSGNYPLVTVLHGASQRGIDGLSNILAGFPLMTDSTTDAARESIIFAPQCPSEYRWVESSWEAGAYKIEYVDESEPLKATVEILNSLPDRYSVDKDRLYITGFSMGGFGVWDLLMRHKDMFAAGMPLCGGADKSMASHLADVPIWAFHGTEDPIVPFWASETMCKAITAAGSTEIKFTPLEGYVHNVWDYTYADETHIEWLFSKKLSDRTK